MGSASRIALEKALGVLAGFKADASTGSELLSMSAALGSASALLKSLADAALSGAQKADLIDRVFAKAGQPAKDVLKAASQESWSNDKEFVAGVEELGLRAAADTTPGLAEELLAVDKVISSDHELELTLGSKLGAADAKAGLAAKLFAGKVSEAALDILTHTVANPAGRRIGKALQSFAKTVADQGGKTLATVTVAAPLDAEHASALEKTLEEKQGRPVQITTVVDPAVIGGMSIRIGDEVIDATVKSRIDNLRLQLSL